MSDEPDPTLGPRLRALRNRNGLSIRAAAEQAGLSASFLSLVERGHSDLAMSRLTRLLQIYGASLSDLAPSAPSREVVHADEALRLHSSSEQIDAYLLVADAELPLVPMVWVYEPGAAMVEQQSLPTDHFSHVIAGEIMIETEDATHRLAPGDTIYLRAGRRFRIRNDGDQPARVLGCAIHVAPVVLPPLPRS